MQLEIIKLSGICQAQRDEPHLISGRAKTAHLIKVRIRLDSILHACDPSVQKADGGRCMATCIKRGRGLGKGGT